MGAKSYRCEFARIGRDHNVPPLDVTAEDADEVAYHVFAYAAGFLGSRGYDVAVNLEDGRGSIEAGRFGSFTVTEVSS